MSSGSYLASAVKRVSIDKGNGESRPLGILTVSDCIAQQVVKTYLEPRLEAVFSSSSYGYRPKKSSHQAISQVRNYVRKYPWVIDLDIKGFFENVAHELLMKALDKHVSEKWVKMYIKRWLEAPVQLVNGDYLFPDGKGIPQGGVIISPLLSNLFLHYSIDKWMEINYPSVDMVSYADDIVIHCQTHQEAKCLLNSLKERLTTCRLEVHPSKTKIVYCEKDGRSLEHKPVQFDFLGFSSQPLRFHLKKAGSFL
ncbi:reverse transcriptase domain-containing protein [Aquimarina agarivorans]|uniref:reverse transcriptase domain-containing protein n=1 Tax=Aquimarina agarivorans TaxID=980584 RepID=UPI000248E7E6|nr:reverse transcriptase domain-containing protein [Aquimarina agarivorans]